METELKNPNMDSDIAIEEESQEQLNNAAGALLNLSQLRKDGAIVSMTKESLSLLKSILLTGTEEYKELWFWRMCSFMDREDALDHIAAYHEAKDLGMSTDFNVSFVFALCSANEKNNFANNLIAVISDTLQQGKWANSQRIKTNEGSQNPRSPLARQ